MAVDWKQVETIFQKALELPPQDRDAWLAESCQSDGPLLEQVRELLRAHAESEAFLEKPASEHLAEAFDSSWNGKRVGPWRITGKLGEGGLGVVFRARRDDGQYQKEAAVKVVRAGLDVETIRIRFRKERQALASLSHPRIPKLLDGGIAESGEPYLVMEYIGGQTMEQLFTAPGQSRLNLVRLLEQVCEAVRYLHSQLMVHADLKPANILVTEEGEARLLDFGSTSWLTPDAEASGVTHLILTPAYASPEQKRGEPARPSCDVFALGRLLQRILEQYPQPADQDLSAIAAKATQDSPADRYETVHEFLQDLERRHNHLPVLARQQTLGYRLGRLWRRRKFELVAAGLAVAGLVAGAVAASVGYWRATQAEAAARQEAATAQQVSKFLIRLFEISDPDKAQGKVITAKDLLTRGTARIDEELRNEPKLQASLMVSLGEIQNKLGDYRESKRLLQSSLQKGFLPGREGELRHATALMLLGSTYLREGKLTEANQVLQQSLELRLRHLGNSHGDIAQLYTALGYVAWSQNKGEEALALHQKALQIHTERSAIPGSESKPIDVAMCKRNIGMAYGIMDKVDEALAAFQSALPAYEKEFKDNSRLADILEDIANAYQSRREFPQALPLLERSMAIRQKLFAPGHPLLAYSFQNLGRLLCTLGRCQEGEPHLQEAIRIREKTLGPDHLHVGVTRMLLGKAYFDSRELTKATAQAQQALTIFREKAGPEDQNTIRAEKLLGEIEAAAGHLPAALPHLRASLEQTKFPGLRPDLSAKHFDPVRQQPAFQQLVAQFPKQP